MFSTDKRFITFEEYLHNNDSSTDYSSELVAGKLQSMNPPTVLHLLITKFLEQIFDEHFTKQNLPWICLQNIGIRTGVNTSRIPDLVLLEKALLSPLLNRSAILEVSPKLVIEIVSPESIKRDYRYKRSEYAAFGIPEYWIIDPIQQKIMVLLWQEGLYEETVFTDQEMIRSQQLPNIDVIVEQVFKQG